MNELIRSASFEGEVYMLLLLRSIHTTLDWSLHVHVSVYHLITIIIIIIIVINNDNDDDMIRMRLRRRRQENNLNANLFFRQAAFAFCLPGPLLACLR